MTYLSRCVSNAAAAQSAPTTQEATLPAARSVAAASPLAAPGLPTPACVLHPLARTLTGAPARPARRGPGLMSSTTCQHASLGEGLSASPVQQLESTFVQLRVGLHFLVVNSAVVQLARRLSCGGTWIHGGSALLHAGSVKACKSLLSVGHNVCCSLYMLPPCPVLSQPRWRHQSLRRQQQRSSMQPCQARLPSRSNHHSCCWQPSCNSSCVPAWLLSRPRSSCV
jgi:hypothetical protein